MYAYLIKKDLSWPILPHISYDLAHYTPLSGLLYPTGKIQLGILYAGFLGSLIDAQNSVIHKGGSNMADEKINKLGWNLVLKEFWGRWLRIRIRNSEIKNGGSKMADPKWRTKMQNYLI